MLTLLLIATVWAEPGVCVVCSVEQGRLHTEECELVETYAGEKYYFCKAGCRDVFLGEPEKWREGLLALQRAEAEDSRGKAGVGDALPSFRLPIQPIGSISKEDVKGKVLLLNFWATWCAPCKAEMPALVKLQEENQDEGLVVLALSFDKTREAHREGVEALGLNFPSIYADQPEVQEFLNKLEPTRAIPVTIVVDREGNIVDRLEGEGDLERFREMVKPYLGSGEQTSREDTSGAGAVVPS